jgi:hypothetical protein
MVDCVGREVTKIIINVVTQNEECIQNIGGNARRRWDHWEDQDVGGWTILKWILREIGWGGMDWLDLARNRDQWRALLNTVMNLRVP